MLRKSCIARRAAPENHVNNYKVSNLNQKQNMIWLPYTVKAIRQRSHAVLVLIVWDPDFLNQLAELYKIINIFSAKFYIYDLLYWSSKLRPFSPATSYIEKNDFKGLIEDFYKLKPKVHGRLGMP